VPPIWTAPGAVAVDHVALAEGRRAAVGVADLGVGIGAIGLPGALRDEEVSGTLQIRVVTPL
jgi:hypothetical protein